MRAPGGIGWVVVVALLGAGCPARAVDPGRPLGAQVGDSLDDTTTRLEARGYCTPPAPLGPRVVYRRCPKPGLELVSRWVEAYFAGGVLYRIAEIEAHTKRDDALRRWNDLVASRNEMLGREGRPRDDLLRQVGELPDGAVSWMVWPDEMAGWVHAVLLVRPSGEELTQVVEVFRRRDPR